MLHAALRAEPWTVPGTMVAALLGFVLMRPLAARLGAPRWVVWLLVTTVGGFCALTVTPTGGAISGGFSTHVIRSLALTLPSPRDLHTINEVSLNVAAGVPLGVAVLAAAALSRRWWLLPLLALPFACELAQGAFPQLGRAGFILGDAINNEVGVAAGVVLAVAALALTRRTT